VRSGNQPGSEGGPVEIRPRLVHLDDQAITAPELDDLALEQAPRRCNCFGIVGANQHLDTNEVPVLTQSISPVISHQLHHPLRQSRMHQRHRKTFGSVHFCTVKLTPSLTGLALLVPRTPPSSFP